MGHTIPMHASVVDSSGSGNLSVKWEVPGLVEDTLPGWVIQKFGLNEGDRFRVQVGAVDYKPHWDHLKKKK